MSGPGNIVPSGQYAMSPAATSVIRLAFRCMGTINEDEVPTQGMYQDGIDSLNALVTEWQATGIHIWTEAEGILFLQQNQTRYTISTTTTDHWADAYGYAASTLASTAVAGATSITVESPGLTTVPFSVGQKIGIVLDTGAAFWTTIKSTPANNVVPLAAALPSQASAQSFCYAYTSNIVRPLRMPAARRLAFAGMIETPLTDMLSRKAYMDLPNKNSPGLVTQAFYNPARDTGEIYVWNSPQDATNALRFTYYRPIQDFSNPDDQADLPAEWQNALKWNLAKELGPSYSVPLQRMTMLILPQAQTKLDLVMGWDREPQSVYFGRGYDQTRR